MENLYLFATEGSLLYNYKSEDLQNFLKGRTRNKLIG